MPGMGSVFSELRELRSLNESTEETQTEVQETETEVTKEIEEIEEMVIVCEECGTAIISTVNESVEECPLCGSENLEEKVKKVVRDGKITKVKVPAKKKRLSSVQKAALAKARKKAHTSSANKARNKSMAKGRKAGLHEEDVIVCPECDYEGTEEEFEIKDGVYTCPECECEFEIEDEKCKNESLTDDAIMAQILEEINAPTYVKNALNEGKYDFVASYIDLKTRN